MAAQLLFVEERDGTVLLDALAHEPLSARVALPATQPLRSLVQARLEEWASTAAPVSWEPLLHHGPRLRIGDGRTTLTLDVAA